ncbi:MAG: hypothetical protein ACFFER_18845 [Candidatus Thorarchaeota archaeon]
MQNSLDTRQGLYERVKREVLVKEDDEAWISRRAWIYLPTTDTIQHPLFPWKDLDDRWLWQEIRRSIELQDQFPEFFFIKQKICLE